MRRRDLLAGGACFTSLAGAARLGIAPAFAQSDGFAAFIDGVRTEAASRGVSRRIVDAAFAGVTSPDQEVIGRITKQSEFNRAVWEYLVGAVSQARLTRGRAQGARFAKVLDQVEARMKVPREIVLAFWGVESDFGSTPGSISVVRALASLAHAGHRAPIFREELLAALQILERGDIPPERMKGSWAGAMGQVQFLPSIFLKHAVDFDGDGHRDIWGSEPDALASIGNYLRDIGWNPDYSWGYEVILPKDFDLTRYRGDLSEFARRGVKRTDGKLLPQLGQGSLFLPGGLGAPVFLVTDNFDVIRVYNTSDSYALAVGHLADRLAGAPALAAPWPTGATRLDKTGLTDLQKGLAAKGFYAGEPDGRAGPKLREAVRQYQIKVGLVADGYASPAVLAHLNAAR